MTSSRGRSPADERNKSSAPLDVITNRPYTVLHMRSKHLRLTPRANAFGELLNSSRLRAHLTLAEVAEIAGLSTSYISELERGTRLPKAQATLKLAYALGHPSEPMIDAVVSSWAWKFMLGIEEP